MEELRTICISCEDLHDKILQKQRNQIIEEIINLIYKDTKLKEYHNLLLKLKKFQKGKE